jgi:hypothetical protein
MAQVEHQEIQVHQEVQVHLVLQVIKDLKVVLHMFSLQLLQIQIQAVDFLDTILTMFLQ